MFERFTDRARKVLALANQEAQRLNHECIGTEHILLGLVNEGSGVGANVLKNLAVDLRKVRVEVKKLVKIGPEVVTMDKLRQTPRAKEVIRYAIEEARCLGHHYVGTEHLLLGLLREMDGVAGQVLINLDVNVAEAREEVLQLLGAYMEANTFPEECSQARRKREQPFRDHPLVRRYRAIKESYDRLKDEAVIAADYELAAFFRDLGEPWVLRVRALCKRLKENPDFAASLPPSVVKHCAEIAFDTDECAHPGELETALEALLIGKTVLIIGELDSGSDKFLGQATSAAFEFGADTNRPPPRFFAPNHDLMRKGEADGGYAGVLATLAQDVLDSETCGFALRELHLYADPATFSDRVIELWGQTLLDCATKQRPIVASTTPDGVTQLRGLWPRLFEHAVKIRIE